MADNKRPTPLTASGAPGYRERPCAYRLSEQRQRQPARPAEAARLALAHHAG